MSSAGLGGTRNGLQRMRKSCHFPRKPTSLCVDFFDASGQQSGREIVTGLSAAYRGTAYATFAPAFMLVRSFTSACAPAVEDAGFWPVISLPSVMAKLSQFGFFS